MLSIVIPTYLRTDYLDVCLHSICTLQQGIDISKIEIIVSDDGDVNVTKQHFSEKYPQVQFIQGPSRGPASNRNHAVANSKGDWLVFIDDDCIASPTFLKNIIAEIESGPGVNVLEGLTRAERNKRRFDEESPENLEGNRLWSCNFTIRRDLFEQLQGFDENFTMAAFEDMDFYIRLKKREVDIKFCPHIVVVHPWRPRKGVGFRVKSLDSLEYLIQCHPELKKDFTLRKGLFVFLVQSKKFMFDLLNLRGRGFFSELYMLAFYLYQALTYARRGRW